MKLKGISKLVLAGTALAATAATLTTATYAWYVTNSTVDATNINGKVSGESIDGSLFISKNQEVAASGESTDPDYVPAHDAPLKYQTEISLSDLVGTDLNPQSKATADVYKQAKTFDSAATYYTLSNDNYTEANVADAEAFAAGTYYLKTASAGDWVDKEGKTIAGNLLTFKFWLRSSNGGDVTFTLKTTNKTTSFVKQQALSEAAYMPTGVTIGDEFVVDAVPALRMERTIQAGVGADKVAAAAATAKVFAVDAITSTYTQTTPAGFATVGQNTDANKYFRETLGEAGYNTNADSGQSELVSTTSGTQADFATVTLGAAVDTLFTFNVWLEGSDKDCWDSARSQMFDFNFTIALASANNGD